ncbi:MAG TPA: tRNA pseudouridine(38-40) synthase TruA [Vicinamibacteria bacterium]|nr:tRNA pseudouridine(38-40) synthase TruA [Vicinamibacteria bacterium]
MARFRLDLEYAGTRYSGWQVQKNARTVQGEIGRAVIEVLETEDFELYGSGRTDAGVHAAHQVAHLDVRTTVAPDALRLRLNDTLPADINLLAVAKVPHRFHARHDAVARVYLYQVARRRTALAKPFVWWVKDRLDARAMARAAEPLVGKHDFRSFSDQDPAKASTLVQLEHVEVGEDGDLVLVRVAGSHFIWKMVRRLVGVLVEAGRGNMTAADVERLLRERSDVPARLTAPPSGLFLERVVYEGETFDRPLTAIVPVGP